MKKAVEELALGLDIGANSIGWSLIAFANGKPERIVRAGVRCFEAGVEGSMEAGRDQSRAKRRGLARRQRRQTERRAWRLEKVARLLQRAGLLPEGPIATAEDRLKFFTELDERIVSSYLKKVSADDPDRRRLAHVVPYALRARALDKRLEPHELGRALYHLAHRRGFKSNRRGGEEEKKETGKVKKAFSQLHRDMQEAGARTLGEYFAGLDPEKGRIRTRYTSRPMYLDEFDQIWNSQSGFHPSILTDGFKRQLHRAIFYQRPLRSQKGRVGNCELERGCRRAPKACFEFQRTRILEQVNNLRVVSFRDGIGRPLNETQRRTLISELGKKRELKLDRVRAILDLPETGYMLNLEEGEQNKLVGNKTAAALTKVFGRTLWHKFSDAERDRILEDVRSIEDDEVLKRRATEVWGLDEQKGQKLCNVGLEPGYCALSRKALKKILPGLEKAKSRTEVLQEIYGHQTVGVHQDLPSVEQSGILVMNPAVHRALTELRKVVNAIIREYGKPDRIRIELARDLKQPRKERMVRSKRMAANRAARDEQKEYIKEQTGNEYPSKEDVVKLQLAKECGYVCPYTQLPMSRARLLGHSAEFEIDHIIPISRCLDDSFANLLLCHVEANRKKGNRTPFEAFGDTPDWERILGRVRKFTGHLKSEKLRRFQLTEDQVIERFGEFAARQLNDTRYTTKLAGRYLSLLYGGRSGVQGIRGIETTKGAITNHLRNAWELNRILSDGPGKSRNDHRHHAVDAIVIALTDPGMVKRLSNAAERSSATGHRRWWREVEPPWDGFVSDVRETIHGVVVSHRVSRKVKGPLHEETYYGHKEGSEYVRLRKPLGSGKGKLSQTEIPDIVDDAIRQRVQLKLEELGEPDPKKAFKSPENHPFLQTLDGGRIPIHRVRLKKKAAVIPVGDGVRRRHVMTGRNHHVEIVETTDNKGNVRWEDHVVTLYDAVQRHKAGRPIVKRDHGRGKKLVFSLSLKESVRMKNQQGDWILARVVGISKNDIEFRENRDARSDTEIRKAGYGRIRCSAEKLRKHEPQKMLITPAGEVRRAND